MRSCGEMAMWLLKDGNAYWCDACHQWGSRGTATAFTDSEVEELYAEGFVPPEAHFVAEVIRTTYEGEVRSGRIQHE
jgi:hypothetical protein